MVANMEKDIVYIESHLTLGGQLNPMIVHGTDAQ